MKVGIKFGKVKKFGIGWCILHRMAADNADGGSGQTLPPRFSRVKTTDTVLENLFYFIERRIFASNCRFSKNNYHKRMFKLQNSSIFYFDRTSDS